MPSYVTNVKDTGGRPDVSHICIDTVRSDKTVRINSRTYTLAASIVGMQCKPRAGVIMIDNIYGAEFEPGINSGFAGKGIVGVASRPTIKGVGAVGDLSGVVYAFEGDIGADSGSTRTIADYVATIKAFNSMHGTVTKGVYFARILQHGGNVPWSGLLSLEAALGTNSMTTNSDKTGAGKAGTLKVYVNDTLYHIQLYANA